MKTYQTILDELAKENSCGDWKYFFAKSKASERTITDFFEEAAKRYAKQFEKI